jgi:hypothetical protein
MKELAQGCSLSRSGSLSSFLAGVVVLVAIVDELAVLAGRKPPTASPRRAARARRVRRRGVNDDLRSASSCSSAVLFLPAGVDRAVTGRRRVDRHGVLPHATASTFPGDVVSARRGRSRHFPVRLDGCDSLHLSEEMFAGLSPYQLAAGPTHAREHRERYLRLGIGLLGCHLRHHRQVALPAEEARLTKVCPGRFAGGTPGILIPPPSSWWFMRSRRRLIIKVFLAGFIPAPS